MTQPFTRLTLETLYPDGDHYIHTSERNSWDLNLDELFELFERLALAAGYSREAVGEIGQEGEA